MWYTRSLPSLFVDSMRRLYLLAAVDKNPRTLCACQPLTFWISASVAPLGRPINARIFAPLLSARRFAGCLRVAFLPVLAGFCRAALVLTAFAGFWPLGPPFLAAALRFAASFSGTTWALCAATVAAVSLVSSCMLVSLPFLRPFWRMTIHHSLYRPTQAKSDPVLLISRQTERAHGDPSNSRREPAPN